MYPFFTDTSGPQQRLWIGLCGPAVTRNWILDVRGLPQRPPLVNESAFFASFLTLAP
jgi:hypothetical protein